MRALFIDTFPLEPLSLSPPLFLSPHDSPTHKQNTGKTTGEIVFEKYSTPTIFSSVFGFYDTEQVKTDKSKNVNLSN